MTEFSVELFDLQADLVQKTIDQINKDFTGYADLITMSDPDSGSYLQIQIAIATALQKLSKQGNSKIQSLLYRVDIPEKFHAGILSSDADYYLILADAIIRREFYKVITRLKYSPHH